MTKCMVAMYKTQETQTSSNHLTSLTLIRTRMLRQRNCFRSYGYMPIATPTRIWQSKQRHRAGQGLISNYSSQMLKRMIKNLKRKNKKKRSEKGVKVQLGSLKMQMVNNQNENYYRRSKLSIIHQLEKVSFRALKGSIPDHSRHSFKQLKQI